MKKKFLSLFLGLIIMSLNTGIVFANNNTSYSSVIDDITNKYGLFKTDENFRLYGLIYGEFIDFDNNGTDEMLVIYKDKNEKTFRCATVAVYASKNGQLTKVFDEGIYSYLGQTDIGYQINIKNTDNKTYLIVNTDDIYAENADIETVSIFSMENGTEQVHKFYGEVLPWWDTYEFVYTKCMIDENIVSEEEYNKKLNSFYENSKCLMILSSSSEFDGGIYYCTYDKLMKFIEQAKNKNASSENILTGTLQERFIKDGMGSDVQCLILTLDSPQSLEITDMYGEKCTVNSIKEIQVSIDNYTSDMNNAIVKITSYKELFEGHTSYHIRPVVMQGAIAEITDKGISVTLNGEKIVFDQRPVIIDGRTLVPLRAIFEKLGATVDWNPETQTVTSTKGETSISMSIGRPEMHKNGTMFTLDVVPQLIGERTLVPVRAVAEGFDCKVEWIEETQTVVITTVD